jgi:deoxyribodipyrimidine photolyase-related protein
MSSIRLILGDQLSQSISSLKDYHPDTDIILMCEVWNEATYVKHHKKKITFLFSAMRHFAEALKKQGFNVEYTAIDARDNSGSFSGEVKRMLSKYNVDRIVVAHPGEYLVLKELRSLENELNIGIEIREDNRFLYTPDEFANWAKGHKQLRMECFYREMRKKYDILMDGNDPIGGQWNYDAENRKPPKEGLTIPPPYIGKIDNITQDCISLVSERFDAHFGDVEPFYFAVTRADALQVLDQFVEQRLPHFGDYQDAMIQGEP